MNKDYVFVQKKTYTHLFPNIYMIGRIYSHTMKDLFDGKTFGKTILVAKDGVIYWYASEKGLEEVAKKGLEMMKENPSSGEGVRRKFEKLSVEIVNLADKLDSINLSKLSNTELWNLMKEYLDTYERVYLWSEPLVLSLNDMLGPSLKSYISDVCGEKKKTTQYYNLLISCPERSFVKREEDDLLKLALDLKTGEIKNREKAVREHKEKYCWVPYDYGAYCWDEKYFNTILDKILQAGNMESMLSKSYDYFDNLTERQNDIISELNIDEYHQELFSAMRHANYLLDYKKEVFTILHWKADVFLKEIAGRLDVGKDLFQYYLPEELKVALLDNKPLDADLLQTRFNNSVVLWEDNKTWFTAVGEADKFLQKYIKEENSRENTLNGIIASAGKCAGPVKVVHGADEIEKVNEGDILVASMTTPEYVPAMRKAGAIITDEGGVMCHASIVSRELGIPCVVGTKTATKIFTDGDMVEVNANHNSVKILKK